jgi:poly(A) polymerase
MKQISIEQLLKTFSQESLLNTIYALAQQEGVDVYLVGGIVRDVLQGRNAEDLDILVREEAEHFAHHLAEKLQAQVIKLKAEKGTIRVVKLYEQVTLNIDISELLSDNICHYLGDRDFTINAMALKLNTLMQKGNAELIDCYAGLDDLNKALIRHIAAKSLIADPLRMVRAFRLSSSLKFKIDSNLLTLIKNNAHLIHQSAGERISLELYHILHQPNSLKIIMEMDKCGLLAEIFPEIKSFKDFNLKSKASMNLWGHSLRTLEMMENIIIQLDIIFGCYGKNIEEHLNKELAYGRARLTLLKLTSLLHDLGKPETFREEAVDKIHFIGHEKVGANMAKIIAHRMKLSSQERDYFSRLIYYHLRPYYLLNSKDLSQRAIYRFFRHLGQESIDCIILFLADSLSYYSPHDTQDIKHIKDFSRMLIKSYFDQFAYQKKQPKLINGSELMTAFNLQPGKLVGWLLEKISEAQAMGEIKKKEEALNLIKRLLSKHIDTQQKGHI